MWFSPMCIDDTFFQTVANLPIQHLELYLVALRGTISLGPPVAPLVMALKLLLVFPLLALTSVRRTRPRTIRLAASVSRYQEARRLLYYLFCRAATRRSSF